MISINPLRNMKSALVLASALLATWPMQNAVSATTSISDLPYFVTNSVPPNVMLALSVEWPTGVVPAYNTGYSSSSVYVGYFDPTFCYSYYKDDGATKYDTPATPSATPSATPGTGRDKAAAAKEYFRPVGLASATHTCSGTAFSGNFLNWSTMLALDAFRFTLTGGDRVIDTETKTVIERTRHTGQGGTDKSPTKNLANQVANVSPFDTIKWSTIYVRTHNGKFNNTNCPDVDLYYTCGAGEFNSFNDVNTRGRTVEISNNSSFAHDNTTNFTYTYLIRVQVCDQSAATDLRMEYNRPGSFNICHAYPGKDGSGTIYKPIGLIQKNASQMRFGASGYLLDHSKARSGGVLRARMKSVGPDLVVANGNPIANDGAEWDEDTGIYVVDPDSADTKATNTAIGETDYVKYSGVINYLNKFGKLNENTYKAYDTLSELYYSILRSMRNMSPVPQYVSGLTKEMTDGFPVILSTVTEPAGPSFTPTDLAPLPIQYYCQQTNILGIADSNVQCDNDVPGNTLGQCSTHTGHKTGSEITDDPDINVLTLGNKLGGLEFGTSNFGGSWLSDPTTNHVASLAYWANTSDMLKDDAKMPWTVAPTGSTAEKSKQQAKTYFVDVREIDSKKPNNNQMWLAAKYGGFDDKNQDGIPSSLESWHTNSDPLFTESTKDSTTTVSAASPKADVANKNGARPDNYFTGDTPDKLFESLSKIFDGVNDRKLSGQGITLNTNNFESASANSGAYSVSFKTPEWSGDVKGYQITYTGTTPTTTLKWSAQEKLDAQISNGNKNDGWTAQRKIVTYDGSAGAPFQWASLNTTQQAYLQDKESMLQYLRGKNCDEVGNKTTAGCVDKSDPKKPITIHRELYRPRVNTLGDIIDSEATVVDIPSGKYFSASGYSAFVTKNKARKRMLYVGANDGMMHAIDGDVGSGTTAGQELWAYVPNMVFAGPTLPTPTPNIDGLAARTLSTGFSHKYYVNQTPYAFDIDIDDTKGADSKGSCDKTAAPECSWRTILVGGLGKGGRGYYAIDVTNPDDWTSETEIAKKVLWEFTDEDMGFSFGRPVVVRTKRDGWVVILSSGYNNIYGTKKGKGILYILNAKTGALIEKITTDVGDEATPSGFAHPAAFVPDYTTFYTDYVYGGDLNGNVWRFDLRNSSGKYPAPDQIATLTSDNDAKVVQPVTTEPRIEVGRNGVDRWVFIGTGQFLSPTDMDSKEKQTFYALRDGTLSSVYGTETGQRGLPNKLTFPITRSNLVATTLLSKAAIDPTLQLGWYYDLDGTGERITQQIVANEGLIAWLGSTASTDACTPGAESRLYVAGYDDGLSRLINAKSELISYYTSKTYLTKITFVKGSDGIFVRVDNAEEKTNQPAGNFNPASGAPVKVNWREIQQ